MQNQLRIVRYTMLVSLKFHHFSHYNVVLVLEPWDYLKITSLHDKKE